MKVLLDKTARPRPGVSRERPAAGIAATAQRQLRESAYLDLRYVRCEFRDGVVTLSGQVPTFYLKQVAQTIVGKLEHVEKVVNQLVVADGMVDTPRLFSVHTG